VVPSTIDRPNIVLIMADDFGYECVGANGGQSYRTPHLDQLAATGTLFSGDAVYDGPLLDELPDSDITAYCATMERLLTLPVTVVHGGHDPSFGRDRLHELARDYLHRRS
jgi:glyoxylase-like metal-dependent hydrolase (beta-lactamase superfamily II)